MALFSLYSDKLQPDNEAGLYWGVYQLGGQRKEVVIFVEQMKNGWQSAKVISYPECVCLLDADDIHGGNFFQQVTFIQELVVPK